MTSMISRTSLGLAFSSGQSSYDQQVALDVPLALPEPILVLEHSEFVEQPGEPRAAHGENALRTAMPAR